MSPDSYCLNTPIPIPTLNFRDLELMHQYSTRTARTLARREFWDIWETTVPQEAQNHHFLMHAILALAALHISHLRSSNRELYAQIARNHYEMALTMFRSVVTNITPENGTATTAFSLLVVLFSTGQPAVFRFSDVSDPLAAFIDILAVLRRGWHVLNGVRDAIEDGALGKLVKQRNNPPIYPLPEITRKALDDLDACNSSSDDTNENKAIFQRALFELRHFFSINPIHPPNWAHILYWPTAVSPEFFSLLQAREPMALLLLAHWSIPLHHAPSLWYMNGWGKRVMQAIWDSLGPEWQKMMWWPADDFGLVDPSTTWPGSFNPPVCPNSGCPNFGEPIWCSRA